MAFEREMGCTAEELRAWLPGASRGRPIEWRGSDGAGIALDRGRVELRWQVLPPRRIALITLPRLAVRFSAHGTSPAEWQAFMRRFDLFIQRGGG